MLGRARGTERLLEGAITPPKESARIIFVRIWSINVGEGEKFTTSEQSQLNPFSHIITRRGFKDAPDAFKAFYRIKELRVATNATWSEVDAMFVPTTPTIYRVDEVLKDPAATNRRLSHYTNFVNLLDLCAIAVPSAFTTNGLPVGATLIAPAFCDRGVIVAGQTFMAAAEHQGRVVAAA